MKYFLLVIFLQVPAYAVELTEAQAKTDLKVVEVKQVKTKADMLKALAAIKLLSGSWAKVND